MYISEIAVSLSITWIGAVLRRQILTFLLMQINFTKYIKFISALSIAHFPSKASYSLIYPIQQYTSNVGPIISLNSLIA